MVILFAANNLEFIYASASPATLVLVALDSSSTPKLLRNYAVCCLSRLELIISVKLGNTTFKFCMYSVYSPTSSSDPVEVVRFYEELSSSLDPIPPVWLTFIMGNFKARLSPSLLISKRTEMLHSSRNFLPDLISSQ